jgi:xylulokinase
VSGPPVYAGLDLGTSGLKGVLLTADGTAVARARASYPTTRPEPGASEQDPADWMRAIDAVVADLRAQADPRRWAGIGLSAMLPTLVLANGDRTLGPAITWEDARAEAVADRLREELDGDAVYRRTGQWLDGRYLLPMAIRAAEGHLPQGTEVLGAKDFVFSRLTGVLLTDPSTASGTGCYDLASGGWIETIADRLPRGATLPDVAPSTAWRPLRPAAAARLGLPAGLPVGLGAADSVLGAVGLGLRRPGDTVYIAGTSSVVLGVAADLVPDPAHRYLVTPLAGVTGWGLEMDLLATGSSLGWLAGLSGHGDVGALVAAAGAADIDGAPLVLPYLAPGEQGALWDPELSGAMIGVHLGTTAAELGRGLLTGIVLESRRCLDILAEVTGAAGPVDLAGAVTTSPRFCSELADATGRKVRRRDQSHTDMSAIGAALVAALGIDGVPLPAAAGTGTTTADPEPSAREGWDRRWERHERARAALTPLLREGGGPGRAGSDPS